MSAENLNNFCGGKEFFQHWITPKGRSGDILLGVNLADFFVKFHFKNKCDGFKWVLMIVYGAAQPEHKYRFLAEFVNSCSIKTRPLMAGGDFNIISINTVGLAARGGAGSGLETLSGGVVGSSGRTEGFGNCTEELHLHESEIDSRVVVHNSRLSGLV